MSTTKKTIIWNVKGQRNSEYQVVLESECQVLVRELALNSEVYGVKVLENEVYPVQQSNGSKWLDNRRVG